MNPFGKMGDTLHCGSQRLTATILDQSREERAHYWPAGRELWTSSHGRYPSISGAASMRLQLTRNATASQLAPRFWCHAHAAAPAQARKGYGSTGSGADQAGAPNKNAVHSELVSGEPATSYCSPTWATLAPGSASAPPSRPSTSRPQMPRQGYVLAAHQRCPPWAGRRSRLSRVGRRSTIWIFHWRDIKPRTFLGCMGLKDVAGKWMHVTLCTGQNLRMFQRAIGHSLRLSKDMVQAKHQSGPWSGWSYCLAKVGGDCHPPPLVASSLNDYEAGKRSGPAPSKTFKEVTATC